MERLYCVAKIKVLISWMVTVIWAFVFAYVNSRYSHGVAQMMPNFNAKLYSEC